MRVYVVMALTGSYGNSDDIVVRDMIGVYSNLALAARAVVQTIFIFGEVYYSIKRITEIENLKEYCLHCESQDKEFYKDFYITQTQLNS